MLKDTEALTKMHTDSVLSYFESPDGQETVNSYFERRGMLNGSNNSAMPNYSEMLKLLKIDGGTTKEGVSFGSIYVDRRRISTELQKQFSVLTGK